MLARAEASGSLGWKTRSRPLAPAKCAACSPEPLAISSTRPCCGRWPCSTSQIGPRLRAAAGAYWRASSVMAGLSSAPALAVKAPAQRAVYGRGLAIDWRDGIGATILRCYHPDDPANNTGGLPHALQIAHTTASRTARAHDARARLPCRAGRRRRCRCPAGNLARPPIPAGTLPHERAVPDGTPTPTRIRSKKARSRCFRAMTRNSPARKRAS